VFNLVSLHFFKILNCCFDLEKIISVRKGLQIFFFDENVLMSVCNIGCFYKCCFMATYVTEQTEIFNWIKLMKMF